MPTPTHRSMRAENAVTELMDGWLQVVSRHHHPPREDVDRDGADHALDLVAFDMDGTLVTGPSSWEMVHRALGVDNARNWERYQSGEIDDREFMRSDIELWCRRAEGVHLRDVERILREAELMPRARELVAELKKRRVATCILSGGLDVLAHRVCVETGIDMYVANGLALDAEGYLRGEGLCYVKINDKAAVTRALLAAMGVRPERAAAVGNSEWDAGMFREVGFGVAIAPVDRGVREAADAVVEGTDMMEVLPHLLSYRPGSTPRRGSST